MLRQNCAYRCTQYIKHYRLGRYSKFLVRNVLKNAPGSFSLFRHYYVVSSNSIKFFLYFNIVSHFKYMRTHVLCTHTFLICKLRNSFRKHFEPSVFLQPEHPERTTHFRVSPYTGNIFGNMLKQSIRIDYIFVFMTHKFYR